MKSLTSKIALVLLVLVFSGPTVAVTPESVDPIAVDISHWKKFLEENKSTDENWTSVKEITTPFIVKAEKALAENRRFYALHLLATARSLLKAEEYLSKLPPDSLKQLSKLEEEWRNTGSILKPVLSRSESPKFDGLPIVVQAICQTAYSEIQPFYEASLEYGKSTVPDAGLYYLGSALGQLDFTRFCGTLPHDSAFQPVNFPSLATEVDAFEDQVLLAYKPPASIDSHPIFIRTSAMIKQSRELYDQGFQNGALYRYLDARLRFARLTFAGQTMTSDEANAEAKAVLEKLDQVPKDNSIARLFVEMAVFEAADTSKDSKGGEIASAVFQDVLPHYFLALQPAPQKKPAPPAEVVVTLVRWPYT